MHLLVLTSLLWALSFGLIKGRLAGLDPDFVASARLAISALIFAPLLRPRGLAPRLAWRLVAIGGVQFGLMYVLYIRAYRDLAAHEVALFTVLTPLWVTLFTRDGRALRGLAAAALACVGAAAIQWSPLASPRLWQGFAWVQAANLCFAWGQVAYRRLDAQLQGHSPASLFGLGYVGALLVAGTSAALFTDWSSVAPTVDQWWTLAYLGAIPSGLGFFLWNRGATRVSGATLAVLNDLKVPLAVLLSLTLFREEAELVPLLLGSALLFGAWAIAERGGVRSVEAATPAAD